MFRKFELISAHTLNMISFLLGRLTTSCSSGQVRLWRPSGDNGPTHEGVALYCRSGSWRATCNYNFNCHTARVMCLQMGYPGAVG